MTRAQQTMQTQLVLRALLHRPHHQAYGSAIAAHLGLSPGVVYRILDRLRTAGWVESPSETGRARSRGRCLCQLTPAGVGLARAVPAPRSHRTDPVPGVHG